jgi:hypothetical protein
MEVEFLSGIQYNLLATKKQWRKWQIDMYWLYLSLATKKSSFESDVDTSYPPIPRILQSFDDSIENNNITFLTERSTWGARKLARFPTHLQTPSHRLEYVAAGSPIIRCIYDAANSPFERCSPRYHLSDSPEYYHRDITSTNPLSFLSPFPIRSSSVRLTPALISSLAPTAHPLKPHEMHYRNIESSKEKVLTGTGRNESPSLSELGLDWAGLTDADAIAY